MNYFQQRQPSSKMTWWESERSTNAKLPPLKANHNIQIPPTMNSSNSKTTKAVGFDQIRVRLYPVVVSNASNCGRSVSLGWDHSQEKQMGIEEYEASREEQRPSKCDLMKAVPDNMRVVRVPPPTRSSQPPLSGFAEWHKLRVQSNIDMEQKRRRRRAQIAQRFMMT